MDVDQRSLALSERLISPCLLEKASDASFGKLVWHRMVVGDAEMDLASQAHTIKEEWPRRKSLETVRLYPT